MNSLIYNDGSNDLGEFAPKGEPEDLNESGGQKPQTESEVDRAMAQFAPVGTAKKYSSLNADAQKVAIPTMNDVANIENRPGGGGKTSD